MKHLPMIDYLHRTKGNPKACMLCEPFWAIPHALVTPFASLFLSRNGCSDTQIGLILSVSMIFQVFFCLIGGILTDKWGRRITAFVSELAGWSIPCLIWFFAHDFIWFLLASVFNAIWQVSILSWTALLVEDCEPGGLVYAYSWIEISGKLAVFLSPISYFLMEEYEFDLVVRGLYLFAFVFMTFKAILLYILSRETRQGTIRRKETRGLSFRTMLAGYGGVLRKILGSHRMLLAFFILFSFHVTNTVMSTFLPLYVTESQPIQESMLSVFSCIEAGTILVLMLTVQGKLGKLPYRPVMLAGFGLCLFSNGLLLAGSGWGLWLLFVFYFFYAVSLAMIAPRKSALAAEFTDPKERARVTAVLTMVTIALSSPISYLLGFLSFLDRSLPFWINILMALLTMAVLFFSREIKTLDKSRS